MRKWKLKGFGEVSKAKIQSQNLLSNRTFLFCALGISRRAELKVWVTHKSVGSTFRSRNATRRSVVTILSVLRVEMTSGAQVTQAAFAVNQPVGPRTRWGRPPPGCSYSILKQDCGYTPRHLELHSLRPREGLQIRAASESPTMILGLCGITVPRYCTYSSLAVG